MAQVGRVRWTTPEPTAVDEELIVSDDGSAMLVVRTSRRGDPVVGTWRGTASPPDLAVLTGVDLRVNLLEPPDDEAVAAADRVAAAADRPVAILAFAANVLPDGRVVLLAAGGGDTPAQVELDPESLVVHLEQADGVEVAWRPVEPLITGFASPGAENLGGVKTPTRIPAGQYGGVVLGAHSAPGATRAAIGLAGWLRDESPDSGDYRGFRARTAAALLP
jgi:hypothetical protein